MKRCNTCGITKPFSEFYKGHCKDGYRGMCKTCKPHQPQNNKWLEQKGKNFAREYIRKTNLKAKFGISVAQYENMFIDQNGCCAICGKPETFIHPKTKQVAHLAVDHCHKTGKIRKLLCARCNRGLGYFQHDIAILKKAEEYLHD